MHDEPRNSSFFTPIWRDASIILVSISKVVVEEIGGVCGVCDDTANSGGGNDHDVRICLPHPALHSLLAPQIEGFASNGNDFTCLALRSANDGAADHPAVPRYPDTAAGLDRISALGRSCLGTEPGELKIAVHHVGDQFFEGHPRLPAEARAGLAGVTDQMSTSVGRK